MIAAGHFCSERGFSSAIQELAKQLVPCTRRLWQLTKVIFFTMITCESVRFFLLDFLLSSLNKADSLLNVTLQFTEGFSVCALLS